MKIGVDIRALSEGKLTGIEVYTIKLLKALFKIDKINEYYLFYNSRRAMPGFVKSLCENKNIKLKAFSYPNKLLNFSFRFLHRPQIDKMVGGLDILFSPNILFSSVSENCKTVVTFHDLSYKIHPEFFTQIQRLWHSLVGPKYYAKKADAIIAVSESTKNDIVDIYKIPERKISVVHSGIFLDKNVQIFEEDFTLNKKISEYNLKKGYLLYFATIEPRKNVETILEAFESFKQKTNSDCKLVVCGIRGWLFDRIVRVAKKSRFSKDIIFTGFIKDEDKKSLFMGASVFVYPSFYEGFGFPPLEAMSLGVPVITSNVSSLPEIVKSGAITVDPYNVNDISLAIEECMKNKDLRQRLITKGFEIAKNFSWESTAKATLEVFNKIVNK